MSTRASTSTLEVTERKASFSNKSSAMMGFLFNYVVHIASKASAITSYFAATTSRCISLVRYVRHLEYVIATLKNVNSYLYNQNTFLRDELHLCCVSAIEQRRRDAASLQQAEDTITFLRAQVQQITDFIHALAGIGLNNPLYLAALASMSGVDPQDAIVDAIVDCIKEHATDKSSPWSGILPAIVGTRTDEQYASAIRNLMKTRRAYAFWKEVAQRDIVNTGLLTPTISMADVFDGSEMDARGDTPLLNAEFPSFESTAAESSEDEIVTIVPEVPVGILKHNDGLVKWEPAGSQRVRFAPDVRLDSVWAVDIVEVPAYRRNATAVKKVPEGLPKSGSKFVETGLFCSSPNIGHEVEEEPRFGSPSKGKTIKWTSCLSASMSKIRGKVGRTEPAKSSKVRNALHKLSRAKSKDGELCQEKGLRQLTNTLRNSLSFGMVM